MSVKIRINEDLLREAFIREWVKAWNDPDPRFTGQPIPDVVKQLAKEIVEKVLKTFRP